MNIRLRHGAITIAVVALVALALTACGKKEEAAPPPRPAATPPPVAAPVAAPASAAVPNSPAAAAAVRPPVAAKGEGNRPDYHVEINELRRTGNEMVTLRMTFINDGPERIQQSVYETGLLDLVEKRRYSPVNKGADVNCICSDAFAFVPPHERVSAWVRFPAPPATVQKVGIELKGFQPIDDVVISQ